MVCYALPRKVGGRYFSVRTTRRILTAAMRIRSKLRRMKYEFAKWLRGLIFLALV